MSFRKLWPYGLALLPWIAYLAITFVSSRTGTTRMFGLDPRQLFFLRLTSILFYLANWLSGCYCVITCFSIARDIPEKKTAFRRIGFGIFAFLVGGMFGTLASASRSFALGNMPLIELLTIVCNYSFAFSSLVGAYLIFSGSSLLSTAKTRVDVTTGWKAIGFVLLAIVSIVNFLLVFSNPDHPAAANFQMTAPYYLPDFVIALTIVVPYLVAYCLTLFTAFHGARYFLNNGGAVYRAAARRFVLGTLFLMLVMLFVQLILSLGPTRSKFIGLVGSLSIIYVYHVLQLTGYLLLVSSLRKISGIERLAHSYGKPIVEEDEFQASFMTPESRSTQL
jgi:hypothetical protein